MNFDIFNNISFPLKGVLLDNCKAAEKNIYIEPFNAIASARPALENLCKGLLMANNVKAKKNADGSVNLATMVETCLAHNMFQSGSDAAQVRKSGNKVLHASDKKSLHIVNAENIEQAKDVVESLFVVMQQAFCRHDVDFSEAKIPFGDFEVVRAVTKAKNEVIVGNYNYFVKDANGDYFYLQVYPRDSMSKKEMSLVKRSEAARSKIKNDKKRRAFLLPSQIAYDLPVTSDRQYVIYSVYEDSMLLSELKQPMTARQAMEMGLDLVNTLLEMKKIGDGIHHRNIQPGCILITPDGESYLASLVNMETSKIQNYEETIIGSIKEYFAGNAYMPREVRNYAEGYQQIDWERVDVYSVAKTILYCVNPGFVAEEVDSDELYDYFSDEMVEVFRVIFESTLSESFDLREFQRVLEDEIG